MPVINFYATDEFKLNEWEKFKALAKDRKLSAAEMLVSLIKNELEGEKVTPPFSSSGLID